MTLPGFIAESSLGPATRAYRGNAFMGESGANVNSAAWPATCLHISAAGIANSDGPAVSPALQAFQGTSLKAKQKSCTMSYAGYVVFPMTVCDPPVVLGGGVLSQRTGASSVAPDSPHVNGAAPRGAAIGGGMFCHVRGGPWFAQVTTTEFCADIPDSSTLKIIGAPQAFAISWSGDITQIPAPFRAQDFSFSGQSCRCCGGFTECPDGRCVPHGVSCDIHPSLQ